MSINERVVRELVAVARIIAGETSLDGMRKQTAKRHVNKILARFSKGLFDDNDWRHVNVLFKAMTAAVIDWTLTGTQYRKNDEGVPVSKEWKFDVDFVNDRGRPSKMYGIIIASGAGTVADPLDKYDIVAYVT